MGAKKFLNHYDKLPVEHKRITYFNLNNKMDYLYSSQKECIIYDNSPLFLRVDTKYFGSYSLIYSINFLQHNYNLMRSKGEIVYRAQYQSFGIIRIFDFGFVFANIL
jgi:hypothetical protein